MVDLLRGGLFGAQIIAIGLASGAGLLPGGLGMGLGVRDGMRLFGMALHFGALMGFYSPATINGKSKCIIVIARLIRGWGI